MLPKLDNITNKWKPNKPHNVHDPNTRVDKTTINIHLRAMIFFAITTLFNA